MPDPEYPLELSAREASRLASANPSTVRIIDVREPHEVEICRVAGAATIPMRQIPEAVDSLPRDQHLLVLCHHGMRSLRVTEFLRARGFEAVTNIAGGIDAWSTEVDPTVPRY
ncbi:MAG: molybdenum cofactor biosynthesis protein MoeB [Verrucomicrobia bacterium]|nr:molybdenum cofactor biosynthesis protein MoeB [Verrucomicrobiota bacterium]